jgi:hypothetical protein
MKFKFKVKQEIEIGGVVIGYCFGSLSIDEINRWIEVDKKIESLNVQQYRKEIFQIFADRMAKSPLADIDFNSVPLSIIQDAYDLCVKELNQWKDPEPVIESAEKKLPIGIEFTTDSTSTIPISGLEIDLTTPQPI